jgi:hypothetical protein
VLVKPEYRPTLPELLRPLPRWARRCAWAALALLAAIAVWLGTGGAKPPETHVVVHGARTFNLAWGARMHRVSRPGALLALENRRNGLFLDSYVVRAVTLPPYRGFAGGSVLPILAGRRLQEIAATASGFMPSNPPEGRTRINDAPGYQITWRERQNGRTIYARDVWLVPPVDGERNAVLIELRSTPAANTPNADRTGGTGALKQPVRSFRFGTERAGGH